MIGTPDIQEMGTIRESPSIWMSGPSKFGVAAPSTIPTVFFFDLRGTQVGFDAGGQEFLMWTTGFLKKIRVGAVSAGADAGGAGS